MSGQADELMRIRKALDLRRGGVATPWHWTLSHSWFTLRVEKPGVAGNLHLFCGDCERVEFERHILDADILVDEIAGNRRTRGGLPSTAIYRIHDRDRLLIECGVLRLEYNVMPVFGLTSRKMPPDCSGRDA